MVHATHTAICETDLALTYALSHPKLARECARLAVKAAQLANRPDLAYRANELLSILR